MKIVTAYICPPVPTRGNDWCAYWEGDEEGPRGWGKTRQEAINDLFDNSDVEYLANKFDIEAKEFGSDPQDYYWVASTERGDFHSSPWRDDAIVSLAFKMARAA